MGELDVVSPGDAFFSFEEFTKSREERGAWWCTAYEELLRRPVRSQVVCTPQLEASLAVLGDGIEAFRATRSGGWATLSPYWKWVIGLHHDEMVSKFGNLTAVEPASIPGGMVSVFKGSRMRWEQ
ncbi:hypothetical protein DFH11DRAFT_1729229 [Phellopilus nigrolimitatus]|nr:hypothetical protein DFH11DRAFT_1729229 [Phellopilus nigrolimitatus]